MATHTTPATRPLHQAAPPPPPPDPDRPRAAPPTVAGAFLLALGALGVFGAVVGYALGPAELSGWDRLSEGSSFGLPSSVVAVAALVMLAVGLVLLGVGIGSARRAS